MRLLAPLVCALALLRGPAPAAPQAAPAEAAAGPSAPSALLRHDVAAQQQRQDEAAIAGQEKPGWKPDLHAPVQRSEVEVFASPDYVEMGKYRNVLMPLLKYGAVAAVHFELSSPKLSAYVVPELVYHDPATEDAVVQQVRNYVSSGRILIVGLSSPAGLNYPLSVLNRAFEWNMAGVDLPCTEPIRRASSDGLALTYQVAPPALPCGQYQGTTLGEVHGLHVDSLPKKARCAYKESEGCAVMLAPYGDGAVVAIGYDYMESNSAWNKVLQLSVDLGKNLKEMMRGNSTISGAGTSWKDTGQFDVYGGKVDQVQCKGWRRTLNCHPAGPRLPKGDRGCTELIPGDESGFCDCGVEFTNAATCSHRTFTCQQACDFLGRQYRDVFGNNYKAPTEQQMVAQLAGADAKYAEARQLADHAVQAVDRAVRASTDYVDGVHASLRPKKTDAWNDIAAAGRRAEEAGKTAQQMVDVAKWGRSRGANIADPVP